MSMMAQSDQVPLQVLLKNVSTELQFLASAAVEVEMQVGLVLAEGAGSLDRLSSPIQRLDHLAQLAIELATFMDEVSRSVDIDVSMDISNAIKAIGLRAMADALVGRPRDGSGPQENLGDVDLF